MSAQFVKLARSSVSKDTTRLIKDLIISGRLKPGDRLPSERELSEMLGISRPTARESIHALVAMNILQTRHGDGTYVSSLEAGELLQPLQFVLSIADGTLRELFEARLVLEPAVSELAAKRATKEQLDAIRECVAPQEQEQQRSEDEMVERDIELHRLIAEAGGNQFLLSQINSLHALAIESRALTVRLPNVAATTVQGHRQIVAAIVARRPAAARKAMEQHIRQVGEAAQAAVSLSTSVSRPNAATRVRVAKKSTRS